MKLIDDNDKEENTDDDEFPLGGMIKYFYGVSRRCSRHHFTNHQHCNSLP